MAAPVPQQVNVGGLLTMKSLSSTLAMDAKQAAQPAAAQDSVLQGVAAQVRRHWQLARDAKQDIEQKMLNAVRSRRGEYPPDKLASIKAGGGSDIYMMLFATKARQAKALLTDVFIGAGTSKPWTLTPTPKPELPPEEVSQIMQGCAELVYQAEMSGVPMGIDQIRQLLQDAKDRVESQIMARARYGAQCAEPVIEDILVEGGWLEAIDQFLDDLTTFPTAFIKGPVIRKETKLKWQPQPDGTSKPVPTEVQKREWVRVDPFNMYPAPWATDCNDAPLIERHKLSPTELSEFIGVPGYSEAALRSVLSEVGIGGLKEWLTIDVQKPEAEGRTGSTPNASSDQIDALQYWGAVSGKMLREWGMTPAQVPDEAKHYQVECWLIGSHVIKCVLNEDPLGRRPYYSDGYSRVPGAFWHNSLFMLIEDCQDMCNAAARALANNLGISSGPQVDVNVQRLAQGETITSMYPWKIWQTTSDPMGSTSKAVNFFQPESNAQELMGVYEKFSLMADEYCGIPRYMTGTEGTPGAGRTASGLSMMIGNASKTIKQLVASVDMRVVSPSVAREYDEQRRTNPNIYGDLQIIARGALSLQTREAAQVRRNEFLAAIGSSPVLQQIVQPEGLAALVRETAKTLDMDADLIVPPPSELRLRQLTMQPTQQAAAPGGEELMNGAPVTDHFSPAPA
jgi:hypothetical protein